MKCPKCQAEAECLAGRSAHPDNWYCDKCGWKAWKRQFKVNDEFQTCGPDTEGTFCERSDINGMRCVDDGES